MSLIKRFMLKRMADKFGPKELVVFDVGEEGANAVLLERHGNDVYVINLAELTGVGEQFSWDSSDVISLCETAGLEAEYCAVINRSKGEQVRILHVPAKVVNQPEVAGKQIDELMAGGDDQTVSYEFIDDGEKNKAVAGVLVGSMLSSTIDDISNAFTGADFKITSVGLGCVAAANLAMRLQSKPPKLQAFLHLSGNTSTLTVVKGDVVAMVRHFDIGREHIIRALIDGMSLEYEIAEDLFVTDSFDFTAMLSSYSPWMHQVGISIDYVERRLGLNVEELVFVGEGSQSKVLQKMFHDKVHRDVRYLDACKVLGDDLLGEPIKGQEKFMLAISEGIGILKGGIENAS